LFEINAQNAAAYLSARGFGSGWKVEELGGGVSNTVLLAEGANRRLVLKQSLGKLRVEQDWFSDRARIYRESGAMQALAPLLPAGTVPEVAFEDRANYAFAMTAAPAGAQTWKDQLLEGDIEPATARRAGEILAAMARASWKNARFAREFGDQRVFDQLRLDPYYRSAARRNPEMAPALAGLIERSTARRLALVHGDWSPKNLLVAGDSVTAIDFEVIHFGDPAFDAAFLLSHLALKTFYRPEWRAGYASTAASFWRAYRAGLPPGSDWIEGATVEHMGGLMAARIDGKSPVEYITDPELQDRVRDFARGVILDTPASVDEVFRTI
jgi:5-methylthioribose kinase